MRPRVDLFCTSILIKWSRLLLSLWPSYSLNLYHHQLCCIIEINLWMIPISSFTHSFVPTNTPMHTVLSLFKWFIPKRRQGYHRHHLLVYNINLYYNQSNSLRIKRDIFPALQNKWSYVNTMHQCDILFDLRRKCNIIIYVVLLALKAYRPFSRIAKSNIYPNINRQHANTMRYHSDFFSLTHTLAFASNCFFCLSPDFFFFFN